MVQRGQGSGHGATAGRIYWLRQSRIECVSRSSRKGWRESQDAYHRCTRRRLCHKLASGTPIHQFKTEKAHTISSRATAAGVVATAAVETSVTAIAGTIALTGKVDTDDAAVESVFVNFQSGWGGREGEW